MALPLQISSSTILEFLVADINAAWGVETIHAHDPEDQAGETASELPEAYVSLQGGSWDGEWASVRDTHTVMRWVIVGRFIKPDAARLHVEKEAKANALLALLTANPRYNSAVWFPQGVSFDFGDNRAEGSQAFYEVRINFTCEF
jgi:hypothetical protein